MKTTRPEQANDPRTRQRLEQQHADRDSMAIVANWIGKAFAEAIAPLTKEQQLQVSANFAKILKQGHPKQRQARPGQHKYFRSR